MTKRRRQHGDSPSLHLTTAAKARGWGILAIGGGGVKTGIVLGATDKHAAEITDRPVSVEDYAATVYHALGMNPRQVYHTLDGRPTESLPAGKPISELIG